MNDDLFQEKIARLHEAIDALAATGDQDDARVINIIDRLLFDDWTGTGVYESCEEALTKAEAEA